MTPIAQCCCGYTLKKGTIIIALLYLSWSIVEIALTANRLHTLPYHKLLHELSNDSGHSADDGTSMSALYKLMNKDLVLATRALLIGGLVLAIIQAICGALLLYGAMQEIPEILLPWAVVQTLVAIISAVIDIITCIAVITPETVARSIVGIVFAMLYVVLSVHFVRVVYDYYQTLRENPKFYFKARKQTKDIQRV